ncbi:MAG: hypothetical protein F4W92_03040 [Gammaproteobacteria bacterium]|nr:hypothetical protein [Gammaproteobacteria bacterium]
MDIDEAVLITQERLAQEGQHLGDLLVFFRDRIAHTLIGESHWQRILERAETLPIEMGALPFGFEIPLHERQPIADFGVSLASGTRTASFYKELQRTNTGDETTNAILKLFQQMDSDGSKLRDIVGRKLMLEYDISSDSEDTHRLPGMFLRPGERPIMGGGSQVDDVNTVVDALVSCVGWSRNVAERKHVEHSYLEQPAHTRTDSFGIFPSRARSIRLAVMGFNDTQELCTYLENTGWPGQISVVESVVSRFHERANVVRSGVNIDVQTNGLGPSLGLTLIVKQRFTKDSRYWLDGQTDWEPFLRALSFEDVVYAKKIKDLENWHSKPTVLFAKSGRFVLLQGIHHIKLVISDNQLQKVKAYLFLVLSGAISI